MRSAGERIFRFLGDCKSKCEKIESFNHVNDYLLFSNMNYNNENRNKNSKQMWNF